MQRERMERVRGADARQGLDALVLLGNTNVVYATGAIWPLADSGRANFEQPVAVVLVDDEWPHLFSPMREDDALRTELPPITSTARCTSTSTRACELFASQLAALVPANAVIAMDEWTNALRRSGRSCSPRRAGRRRTGDQQGQGDQDARRAVLHARGPADHRTRHRRRAGASGARRPSDRLTATFLRTIFDAGADANILDPIWQVMPARMADGPWTTTGDLACPLLSTDASSSRATSCGSTPASATAGSTPTSVARGSSDASRMPASGRSSSGGGRSWTPCSTSPGPGRPPRTSRRPPSTPPGCQAVDAPLLPRSRLGIDSAEMPYVGSDIGEAFDATLVLAAGMVLVLEPIVWEDGAAGYRSEEVLLITEDGWEPMTDYPYDPF